MTVSTLQHLVQAFADGNVPRMQRLVQVALKQGLSAEAIIERIALALQGLYTVKSFTEGEVDLTKLIRVFGGNRAVYALAKALGLPSNSTVYKLAQTPPVLPSPAAPKASEILANIRTFFGAETENGCRPKALHQAQIDGIHLAQRVRYHKRSNTMLGLAREDVKHADLEMTSVTNVMKIADAVHGENPTIRYAKEATVAAVGALRTSNYRPLPIMLSGTGKSEKSPEFAGTMRMLIETWYQEAVDQVGPLTHIATDRDAMFRATAYEVLFKQDLLPTDPLYTLLAVVPGMNFAVGPHNVIWAPDTKHMIKSKLLSQVLKCSVLI